MGKRLDLYCKRFSCASYIPEENKCRKRKCPKVAKCKDYSKSCYD